MELQRQSVITCPQCGRESEGIMPVDACTWTWECPECKSLIKPKPGDCCVFCSYGTVPCPSAQQRGQPRACN